MIKRAVFTFWGSPFLSCFSLQCSPILRFCDGEGASSPRTLLIHTNDCPLFDVIGKKHTPLAGRGTRSRENQLSWTGTTSPGEAKQLCSPRCWIALGAKENGDTYALVQRILNSYINYWGKLLPRKKKKKRMALLFSVNTIFSKFSAFFFFSLPPSSPPQHWLYGCTCWTGGGGGVSFSDSRWSFQFIQPNFPPKWGVLCANPDAWRSFVFPHKAFYSRVTIGVACSQKKKNWSQRKNSAQYLNMTSWGWNKVINVVIRCRIWICIW